MAVRTDASHWPGAVFFQRGQPQSWVAIEWNKRDHQLLAGKLRRSSLACRVGTARRAPPGQVRRGLSNRRHSSTVQHQTVVRQDGSYELHHRRNLFTTRSPRHQFHTGTEAVGSQFRARFSHETSEAAGLLEQ